MGEWVTVFENLSESIKTFPVNSSKTIRIGTYTICLSRLHDGFFALDDKCPHEGISLSKGRCLPQGAIECPWHQYLFDVRTGKNIGNTCSDNTTYIVSIENNELRIKV